RPEELVIVDAPGVFQGRTTGTQVMSVPMFRGLSAAAAGGAPEAPGTPGVPGAGLSGIFARFDVRATIGIGNSVERGYAELVSGDYFRTLGVGTVLGRTLGP